MIASKLRVTGLREGIARPPEDSPRKRPVARKMFPFADVMLFVDALWGIYVSVVE